MIVNRENDQNDQDRDLLLSNNAIDSSSCIEVSFAGVFEHSQGNDTRQKPFILDSIVVPKALLGMSASEILNWILDHVRVDNNHTTINIFNTVVNNSLGISTTTIATCPIATDLEWIKSLSHISPEKQQQFTIDAQFTQNLKSAVEILQLTIIAKYIHLFRITTYSDLWQLLINIGFISQSITANQAGDVRKVLRKAWILLGALVNSRPLLTLFVANCATLSSLDRLKTELINPKFLEYAFNSPVKTFGRRTIQDLAAKYEKENIPFDAAAVQSESLQPDSMPAIETPARVTRHSINPSNTTALIPLTANIQSSVESNKRTTRKVQPLVIPSTGKSQLDSSASIQSKITSTSNKHNDLSKPIRPSKQSKSKSQSIPELSSASDSETTVEEEEIEPIPIKPIKRSTSTPVKRSVNQTVVNESEHIKKPSKLPKIIATSASSLEPTTSAQLLHAALVKQRSMPILEYYFQLMEQYPDQIQIQAANFFADSATLNQCCDHRLQEYCQSHSIVYSREFLLNHSQRFKLLPAYQPLQPDQLHWYNSQHSAISTKVWVFCPDFVDQSKPTNSERAMNLYVEYYPDRVDDASLIWDVQQGEIISLPAELLLKAGVHILLVIHRESEILCPPATCPLYYKSPCAHTVHTLPDAQVFSAAGNYASAKHVLDTFQYKQSQHGSLATEKVELGISGLPVSIELAKPTTAALQQLYKKAGAERRKDKTLYRRAWAIDLESPAQCLYLLHSFLSTSKRPISAHLLNDLTRAHQSISDSTHHQALAVILAEAALLLQQQRDTHQCQSLFGCGFTSTSNLSSIAKAQHNGQSVFALSHQCYVQPLLFIRLQDYDKQREVGDHILQQLHNPQQSFHCNATRPVNNASITVNQTQTVRQMHLADKHYEYDKLQFGPLPLAQSQLTREAIYIQDIHHEQGDNWTNQLNPIIPGNLASCHALQFCALPTPGVHTPSIYYYLHNQLQQLLDRDQQASLAVITEQHNESQRLGSWHFILPQCNVPLINVECKSDLTLNSSNRTVHVKSQSYKDFKVELFEKDIEHLRSIVVDPGIYLTDDLVDFMMLSRIKLRSDRLSQLMMTPFRCGFLTSWEQRKWKLDQMPKYHCGSTSTLNHLFSSDIVFLPLSFHQHYSLAVLYNAQKYGTDQCKLEHYDSLRTAGHDAMVQKLCEALDSAYRQEYPERYEAIAIDYNFKPIVVRCDQQSAASADCGFHTLAYAEQVLQGQERKLNGKRAVSYAKAIDTPQQWLNEILLN